MEDGETIEDWIALHSTQQESPRRRRGRTRLRDARIGLCFALRPRERRNSMAPQLYQFMHGKSERMTDECILYPLPALTVWPAVDLPMG